MINRGARIGIVCCSNGQKRENIGKIRRLEEVLRSIGLQPVFSDYIYEAEDVFSGTARERARALMDFYKDDRIEGIFDISGGDIANGILPYLDYEVIAGSRKTFWGYSDLTTVINAIYARTGRASVLYQIRNLLYDYGDRQIRDFRNTVINHTDDLFRINYKFLFPSAPTGDLTSAECPHGFKEADGVSMDENHKQAPWIPEAGNGKEPQRISIGGRCKEMRGTVVGGNIRCFLKLAGTEYMPDLKDKILLLESFRGTAAQMETYLCQLEQLGAFRKAAGVLLGTFTEMQEKNSVPSIETLVRKFAGDGLPVAVTGQVGHGTDAKGIWIGKELTLPIDVD